MDTVIDLSKACGRELSEAEAARLREVGSRLNLRDDDALWPLLAAMEYQRIYYEALPEKIAGASRAIMDGMTAAAEKETAAAQAKLTNSVVKEAQNLASKIQYGKLVPMWLLALICLLAYGSLMLWAGFRIDTGRDMPLAAILHMPSGLARQRAVSRCGCVLWRIGCMVVFRGEKRVAEKCDSRIWIYDGWRNALHKFDINCSPS